VFGHKCPIVAFLAALVHSSGRDVGLARPDDALLVALFLVPHLVFSSVAATVVGAVAVAVADVVFVASVVAVAYAVFADFVVADASNRQKLHQRQSLEQELSRKKYRHCWEKQYMD